MSRASEDIMARARRHSHFGRKVYAPRAPPNFKGIDHKEHFRMHYGTGFLDNEIERARKRAMAAGGKTEYVSPLGEGFTFADGGKGRRGPSMRHSTRNSGNTVEFEYEEAHYYDSNGGDMSEAQRILYNKEQVRTRAEKRRKNRRPRKRDEEQDERQQRKHHAKIESAGNGCVVM